MAEKFATQRNIDMKRNLFIVPNAKRRCLVLDAKVSISFIYMVFPTR